MLIRWVEVGNLGVVMGKRDGRAPHILKIKRNGKRSRAGLESA